LGKIWIKFDQIWAKIKILHPQKHSISCSVQFIYAAPAHLKDTLASKAMK